MCTLNAVRHSVTENAAAPVNESETLPGSLRLPPAAAESLSDCCPRPKQPYRLVSLDVLVLGSKKESIIALTNSRLQLLQRLTLAKQTRCSHINIRNVAVTPVNLKANNTVTATQTKAT